MSAILQLRPSISAGRVRDGSETIATGRAAQSQAARTLTTASTMSAGTGLSARPPGVGVGGPGARGVGGDQGAEARAPAQVGEPAQRAARLSGQLRRDLARYVDAQVLHPARPHPARRHFDTGPQQPVTGGGSVCLAYRVGPGLASAVIASSAGRGSGVVELAPQVLHPAVAGGDVPEHCLLLAGALGRHPGIAASSAADWPAPKPPGRSPAAEWAASSTKCVPCALPPRTRPIASPNSSAATHSTARALPPRH